MNADKNAPPAKPAPAAIRPPFLHPSSSLILHPFLAGALLGVFLSRFWYELDPIRFAAFGDWPGVIGLAVAGAMFLAAQWWFALRRFLPADAMASAHVPFALLSVYILWPEVDLRLAAMVLLASVGLAVALALRAWTSSPYSHAMSTGAGERRRGRGGGEVLALIVFVIYLRTLGAHVGGADTFEFQVVAPALGVAHPTGYPLYVLIGGLFSLLPIGSTAFRVNLTSAVFATLAVLIVYAIVARLGGRRLVAFIAALTFAVSQVMWSQAVVAEVYALNALIAGLAIALLIDLASSKSASGDASYIVPTIFLVLGLGISHHLTTILLLPAFVAAIVIARPRLHLRTIFVSLGLFLLGLAMWLYIPLRWPALHDGTPMTLGEFTGWITGSRFGGALALGAWSDPTRWSIVGRFLLDAFGPIGLALAAVGLIGLAIRRRRAALITFIAFAAYVFYGLVYLVPDVSVFLIPAYLILAIWIGIGVATLIGVATRRLTSPALYAITLTGFVVFPILIGSRNFPLVDQRDAGADAEAWGRYVLSLPIPDGAAILADSEKIAPLYYLQVTESLRPDLDILVLGTEEEYRRELDTRLVQGQPVYLARYLPNLPYAMRSLGPLVEVSSERVSEPFIQLPGQQTSAQFGEDIELVGWLVEPGDPARVTFEWRALTDSRPNYHVRLRLIDAGGAVWWEDSGTHPVSGYYPTGAWAKGEVVADYHEIDFDPAFPPGAYTLQVGLFPPFRDDGLLTDRGQLWLNVTSLQAPPAAAPPLDRSVRQVYGGSVVVSGADSLGTLPQSGDGPLRINWAVSDARSLIATLSVGALNASTFNLPLSTDATLRQTVLHFRAPDRDGPFTTRLGFVDANGAPLPAKCGWLAPLTLDCPIGVARVEGEAIGGAINFDNQVLLTGWSIDRTELHPGETIHVTLNWRGLKTWQADYTAFVHLIGPDGKLHGQVDAWPVQGTLPTSVWAAGQPVVDPYAVTLLPDAPGGRYQIEVGWYLLATLRRLNVLDAASRPVDDRVIIGEFTLP